MEEIRGKTETHVAIDEPQTGMEAAPDVSKVEEPIKKDEPRKLTKLEIKKLQARAERRRRLLNKGVKEEDVARVMMEEDYRAMPLDKRFELLQNTVVRTLTEFQQDIVNLRHNDSVLADAMDVNFRSMAQMFVAAGVSLEKQKEIIEETQRQIAEDSRKKAEARRAAAEAAKSASEKEMAEAELKAAEQTKVVGGEQPEGTEGSPDVRIAEGATAFGEE